jgi:hypothetical protein
VSELQSWPWRPSSIWCEEEREDLGFGSEREERERENRKGEKKKRKKRKRKQNSPVAQPVPFLYSIASNGPNLLEFFKNIQRLKSLWLDRPPVSL